MLVLCILVATRRIADAPPETRPRLDFVGAVLSAIDLALVVFGVLRSGEWGWIHPKPSGPSWANLSPTVWLVLSGLLVIWTFFRWEERLEARGGEPLVRPGILQNRQLTGGLIMFLFQFLMQAGLFFVVPLYLSVPRALRPRNRSSSPPALAHALVAALGIPRLFPTASPRLVVRCGVLALAAGTVVLLALIDETSGPEIVFVPMLLIGLGIGAMASQLGAVTVSAVPDEQSSEVGGVQNTATNLGASLGTAIAGSILISAVTAAFVDNIQTSPAIPQSVKSQAQVELADGVPFISDADLETALSGRALARARPRPPSRPTRTLASTASGPRSRFSRSSP